MSLNSDKGVVAFNESSEMIPSPSIEMNLSSP